MVLDKIPLFEKRNRVSVNVYGCDVNKARCQPFLLQKELFRQEEDAQSQALSLDSDEDA